MADKISEIIAEENRERRDSRTRDAHCAHCTIQKYESVEVKSLLELALGKKDMVSYANGTPVSEVTENREGHTARCGASFVVPIVIGFLEVIASDEFKLCYAVNNKSSFGALHNLEACLNIHC